MTRLFPSPGRCFRRSDLYTAYASVLDAAGYTEPEQDALFRGNAVKYYNIAAV